MAKRYVRNRERQEALALLGKELIRRAHSHCELCDASGSRLSIWEVAPILAQPETERSLLLCDCCLEELGKLRGQRWQAHEHWRSLNYGLWSQTVAAQVMSVRILKKLSEQVGWAAEMLEAAYLDDETQCWVDATELAE